VNSEQAGTMPRLTAKGRATRERILQVAADLILQHGVAGTGIDDVRAAAGVSGSQMTHYFRDKRHLVKDVIAWQAEYVLHQHQAPELGELDSFAALRLWAGSSPSPTPKHAPTWPAASGNGSNCSVTASGS
jgi:AcrR family transcriptional regulator